MPSAQTGLPRTKFGDIEFPGEQHVLEGEARHHIFVYPHTPGGYSEKLGRDLYTVTIRGNFQATFPLYPNLYPNGMNTIRSYFEQEATKQLTHPTVGTFPAFITKWRQVKDAKMLSGEKVDITFLEDQNASFALADQLSYSSWGGVITPSADRLAAELASVRSQLALTQNDLNLFAAIQQLATDISSVKDTISLYGNDYSNKLQALASNCAQLEATFSLQDARAWPVVDALLDVWQGAKISLQDIASQQATMDTYTVPFTQTMADVAITLYGDASRQSDLISLNPTAAANSLSVPANTKLQFYPLAS